ncbi:MAG TPA: SLC13 family permease [Alphaproteobacteria bacterium]|nr:SLC13 family permease [Alphaproteobacteria bacterium]
MFVIDAEIQMWAIFALILAALVAFARERWPLELTALSVIAALLVFFYVFPVPGVDGRNLLASTRLLAGFASPALITVLALLVIGEGLKQTGVLDQAAQVVFAIGGNAARSIAIVLVLVMVISAFLNNIPVVVMFIPIMQALAARVGRSPSSVMIPLSFVAVLGGMGTLIGSSTNLLVSGELGELGLKPFGFFDFTVPGVVLASVGFFYAQLVAPRLLPDRGSMAGEMIDGAGKQFIAQLTVQPDAKLVGASAIGGFFSELPDVTVRMILRGEQSELPPFDEDFAIAPGDVLLVAATRKALTTALHRDPGLTGLEGLEEDETDDAPRKTSVQMLGEVMVTPSSRLIGQSVEQAGFRKRFGCVVLGIQRRSRMIRAQVNEIRLEAGDVLLIQGRRADVRALRRNPHALLMEWSASDLPRFHHSRRAILIFALTVGAAASGLAPIVVATVAGVAAMIAVGCLNIRQAAAALDRSIMLTIAMALALGAAMQATGGATFLADALTGLMGEASPAYVLSAFFLMVALLSNLISTKAAAVLFTPIAVGIAKGLGVDPLPFAVAVVFAANCSFASPIGYQTNLLVMAPGHYRFLDFARAGLPLIFVLWIVFSLFAPWYYGFN